MLINGIHLLPDLSGAAFWQKERLVVFADPLGDGEDRAAIQAAAEAVKLAVAVLRQRRPAKVVWLGSALPRLIASGRLAGREAITIGQLADNHAWTWVAEDLPDDLPGSATAELAMGALTFRHCALTDTAPGEISGFPSPVATADGETLPCFILDGRRLVVPALGADGTEGANVHSLEFQALFRKGFTAMLIGNGRILTRPREKLDSPAPQSRAGRHAGKRMKLFGAD